MSTQQSLQKTASSAASLHDENILVVKRSVLFSDQQPEGFYQGVVRQNIQHYESVIRAHAEFLPRSEMERDEGYKQIIPYLVFTYQGQLFLMKRSAKASEQRLASKYSLGIGGHVRQCDIKNCDIAEWGRREFEEEIDYKGSFTMAPIGILNDDSNAVGRVHAGIVYLLHADSDDIKIKSELEDGSLLSIDECKQYYDRMEPWSKLVFDALLSARYI